MTDPSMIAKIKALLAKTTASSGCSPSEMEAALAKALELMDKYHIDQLAIDLDGETAAEVAGFPRQTYKRVDFFTYLTIPVARFTNCWNWREGDESKFFGLPSDLVFADWLLDSLCSFIKRNHDIAAAEAMLEGSIVNARWSRDFLIGACRAIQASLLKIVRERNDAAAWTYQRFGRHDPNALIIVRRDLVREQFQRLHPDRWRDAQGVAGRSRFSTSGYEAGKAAGQRATFSRPMGGPSGPKLLGR